MLCTNQKNAIGTNYQCLVQFSIFQPSLLSTFQATRSENAEAFRDKLKPIDCSTQKVLGIADIEIPVLDLENNGNVEKAETISKELGDVSTPCF
jgi:hypothetical protein